MHLGTPATLAAALAAALATSTDDIDAHLAVDVDLDAHLDIPRGDVDLDAQLAQHAAVLGGGFVPRVRNGVAGQRQQHVLQSVTAARHLSPEGFERSAFRWRRRP